MVQISITNLLKIVGFLFVLAGGLIKLGMMQEHMRWQDQQIEERKQIAEHRWTIEHGAWNP